MLVTALCLFAFSQQDSQAPHDVATGKVPLVLYKEKNVYVSNVEPLGDQTKGTSIAWTCVGQCNWTVMDGGIQGTPVKIYKGDSKWTHKGQPKKKGAFLEDRTASFTMLYIVGLDGIPLRSE